LVEAEYFAKKAVEIFYLLLYIFWQFRPSVVMPTVKKTGNVINIVYGFDVVDYCSTIIFY